MEEINKIPQVDWISVNDDLPNHFNPVPIVHRGNVGVAAYNNFFKEWVHNGKVLPYVSHWINAYV